MSSKSWWRTSARRALLAALALLGMWDIALAARPIPMELVTGLAQLGQERPRMAIVSFRRLLKENPDHLRARSGLVRAYRDLGSCGGVVEHATFLEGTRFWQPNVMTALGECEADVGNWSASAGLLRQAIERQQPQVDAAMALAEICAVQGDEPCLHEAWAEALTRDRGPAYVALHEAELAVLSDAPDADAHVEALLAYSFLPDVARQQSVLRVRRALASGDVDGALLGIEPLSTGRAPSQDLAVLRADVFLAAGHLTAALVAARRPAVSGRLETTELAATRARVLAALWQFDNARRALVGLPDNHPDVIAAHWYLAREEGREAEAAAWQARWLAHPIVGRVELDARYPRVVSEESP